MALDIKCGEAKMFSRLSNGEEQMDSIQGEMMETCDPILRKSSYFSLYVFIHPCDQIVRESHSSLLFLTYPRYCSTLHSDGLVFEGLKCSYSFVLFNDFLERFLRESSC